LKCDGIIKTGDAVTVVAELNAKSAVLAAERDSLKEKLGKLISAIGPWSTTDLAIKAVEKDRAERSRLKTVIEEIIPAVDEFVEYSAKFLQAGVTDDWRRTSEKAKEALKLK